MLDTQLGKTRKKQSEADQVGKWRRGGDTIQEEHGGLLPREEQTLIKQYNLYNFSIQVPS